jgi:acyl-CoA synthetase (AMP-forming)/AMP-acid ligase II
MAATGSVTTYAQFERSANSVAHLFRQLNLKRGDHIALLMENRVELLLCESGAERTGLYYTPVNTHLNVDEIAYIVNDSTATTVVVSAGMLQISQGLISRCPQVRHWLASGVDDPTHRFQSLEKSIAEMPAGHVADEILGAPMMYSSGTTGRPKGILRRPPDCGPGDATERYDLARLLFRMRQHDMVYLSPAPLYHSAPQSSVSLALRLGATAIVMERFDAQLFLRLIGRYKVTHTQVVPTMFSRLLQLPQEIRQRADLASLEWIVHAAAPCPPSVKTAMIEWVGPILSEYYSATEAFGATIIDSQEWLCHRGSVGRAIRGDIVIADENDNECQPGVIGTIWFRGPIGFEYFGDPEKTAAACNSSRTMATVGDVGYLDEEHFLYLTDRKSMMIISGGVNIYPQEVENVLAEHEKVFDVAVIGVPNPEMGEEVRGIVQVVPGVEASPQLAEELRAYCRDRLAHFKCPRAFDFMEELPRLPTGKLAKRILRKRYWPNDSGDLAETGQPLQL